MLKPVLVLIDLAITLRGVAVGVGVSWLLRRRSTLSVRNLYPPAILALLVLAAAAALS